MKNMSDIIMKVLKSSFTVEKINQDLLGYLNENCNNWFIKDGNDYLLEVRNLDNENYEQIRLNSDDEVTILNYFTELTFRNDFYYYITIAIGTFFKNDNYPWMFEVSKCLAKLKYNGDPSLYDIEFYLTEINKKH